MTENNKGMQPASQEDELVLVLDGIYSEIAKDINSAKSAIVSEVKYAAVQSQSVEKDLAAKLTEQLSAIKALSNELKYSLQQNQSVHSDISETIKEEVSSKLDTVADSSALLEEIDKAIHELQEKIDAIDADTIADKVVAAFPAQEEVDYDKIGEVAAEKAEAVASEHSKQVLDAVAAIPVAENVDYTRIVEEVGDRVLEIVQENTPAIDYDKLSDMVAAKVVVAAPEIDYDLLAEKVAEKLAAKEETSEVFIDGDGVQDIADTVACKISETLKVEAAVDYDKVADVLIDRLSKETFTFEEVEVIDEPIEEVVEEPVAEEIVEAVAEPVAEEIVEVVVEAAAEETAVAEVEEEPAPAVGLVDADSGMVLRLKKSFIAKLKQSEDDIKTYYSILKNALIEYKKINSNISWHGDRFNFGRDTVARVTIIGKTLGLYLALDPADPEFKQTVYRQKDVSKQKAYDGTPFMVKIKSDGGLKKALRLVAALAEKLGTEKEATFETVDYVAMYPMATDEEMLEEGLIKATKEKKVALDF